MRLLSTSEWHAVRYVMPMAAIVLAAGLDRLCPTWRTGYCRDAAAAPWSGDRVGVLGRDLWPGASRRHRSARACPCADRSRRGRADLGLDPGRSGTTTPSWSDYEVSAPLSSRRQIYGCELDANLPKKFPELGP